MEKLEPKRERRLYGALFILLFLLFFIARFPFREARAWAIWQAADSAEVNISLGDSSLLFPLGLELEDVLIVGKGQAFTTPRFEVLGVRANPFSLIGSRKEVRFLVVNGGEGQGTVAIEGGNARINIESRSIEVGGLRLGNGAAIERGKVSIKGSLDLSTDYRKGKGAVDLSGSDMFIKNASPFLSELPLRAFSASIKKEDANVSIKFLSLETEGLLFKGQGSVELAAPVENSRLDFSGKVDLSSDAGTGPLSGLISMMRGVTGDGDNFTLQISGSLLRPDLKINGKKLF